MTYYLPAKGAAGLGRNGASEDNVGTVALYSPATARAALSRRLQGGPLVRMLGLYLSPALPTCVCWGDLQHFKYQGLET